MAFSKVNVNWVPLPRALFTVMDWPWASMIFFTIARPKPDPTWGEGVWAFSTL